MGEEEEEEDRVAPMVQAPHSEELAPPSSVDFSLVECPSSDPLALGPPVSCQVSFYFDLHLGRASSMVITAKPTNLAKPPTIPKKIGGTPVPPSPPEPTAGPEPVLERPFRLPVAPLRPAPSTG